MSAKHHPALAHHFESLEQQHQASTLGMWMFLATEVLFFGGIFCAYSVLRWWYPDAFTLGSGLLDLTLGTVNTAVLLSSSLTMALAVRAAQTGQRQALVGFLTLTLLLGLTFLGIKAVEYTHDYHEHLIPSLGFELTAENNPEGLDPRHVELFFWIYFVMTGLHALHMIIGMAILGLMLRRAREGRYTSGYYTSVEVMGLYWHFVDIIWIFLFPLLYLIGTRG